MYDNIAIKQEDTECRETFEDIVIKEEDLEIETDFIDKERNEDIKQHSKLSYSGPKTYKCTGCNFTFDFKGVGEHMSSLQGCTRESYQCNICSQYFLDAKFDVISLEALRCHEKKHCGEIYQCKVCNICFSTKDYLNAHQRTHTRDKAYPCSHCDMSFDENSILEQHTRLHSVRFPSQFQCSTASKLDKSFDDQLILGKQKGIRSKKSYTCNICNKRFHKIHELEEHHRWASTGDKSSECQTRLDRHLRGQGYKQNNLPTCKICHKRFRFKHKLEKHQKSHRKNKFSSEKQFQCSYCHQYFDPLSFKGNKDKPDKCNQCEKVLESFEQKYLKGHKKLNTENKSVASNVGNKSFTQESKTIVKQVSSISDKQFEIEPDRYEPQEDIIHYTSGGCTLHRFEFSSNNCENLNNKVNANGVNNVSHKKSSASKYNMGKTSHELQEVQGNVINNMHDPSVINPNIDASEKDPDLLIDVKVEEISIEG